MKKTKKIKVSKDQIAKYLSIKYPTLISYSKDDKVYFVEFPDLPGCCAHGKTRTEALKNAEGVKKACIQHLLEFGQTVPVPKEVDDEVFSGKFMVRMDPSLHKQLAEQAEREGRSLNRLVVTLLSGAGATRQFFKEMKARLDEQDKKLEQLMAQKESTMKTLLTPMFEVTPLVLEVGGDKAGFVSINKGFPMLESHGNVQNVTIGVKVESYGTATQASFFGHPTKH